MSDILKLALILASIIVMLRRKVKVGYVMLIASGALALVYLLSPWTVLSSAWEAARNQTTIKLLVALTLIRMLEMVLRERDLLRRMMEACRSMFISRKAVLVSMPLLIGMLPSVGGAYFSAPLVKEAAEGLEMSGEEQSFVNYWFRHPWEYVSPMYPGLLLASALSGVKLQSLMLANLPYALVMLVTGFIFSMRAVGKAGPSTRPAIGDLLSFLPIVAVLVPVMAFGVKLWITLSITVAGLFIFYRYRPKDMLPVVRHGLSLDVIVLIFGVMFFKTVLENSGAVAGLSRFFTDMGIPLMPTLVVLPVMAGLLTGLAIGFVGATFPLLASLAGGETSWAVSLAFGAGFVGVLLSPVHVCLILTREYFAADMSRIYRRMLVPAVLVLAVACAQYLLFR